MLLRRVFGPLERLTGTMRRVDPHDPGRRVALKKPVAEVAELARAFNDMLDRLEDERQGSARRALAAQEGERLRVARELHDEVGQTLTGVVLALEGIHRRAPEGLHDDLADVQEAARAGVEQVREIARGLRPGPLEELGLRSALTTLATSFGGRTGLRVRHTLAADLPVLSAEQDLAVYRVAQESLTNVARHARAQTAELELSERRRRLRAAGPRRRLRHPGGARRVDRGRRRRHARAGAARRRPPARARAPRARNRSAAGPVAVPLTTRILLADDHAVVRRGLRMVLDAEPDLTVVAEAGDGIEAVELGLREPIDLAVIDVAMPKRTGLDAARELLKHRPEMRILMLSMHDVEEFCFQALKAGASGYVLKTVADKELVEACRAAMRGEPFLSPPTIAALMRTYLDDPDARPESPLTPREREVVKLIAEAHTTDQIAELLTISPRTVERHRENILAKLGMRDRVELTRWAIRHGLIEA